MVLLWLQSCKKANTKSYSSHHLSLQWKSLSLLDLTDELAIYFSLYNYSSTAPSEFISYVYLFVIWFVYLFYQNNYIIISINERETMMKRLKIDGETRLHSGTAHKSRRGPS